MDIFKFFCSQCNKKYSATNELVGKVFDCKACGESITIPTPDSALEPIEAVEAIAEPSPPPAKVRRDETGKIVLAKSNCDFCGGPLDLMGDCAQCEKKLDQARGHAEANKPPAQAQHYSGIMAKAMGARVPGMQKVVGGKPASDGKKKKRKRR
jgi:predicted amidophosphoribosyltransferase